MATHFRAPTRLNISPFADTVSTDSETVMIRNRSLWIAVSGLQSTFHAYQKAMEELVETPLQNLSNHTDIRADKARLKDSEKILRKHVLLLIDGVKTMKKAMTKHSKKIDELLTQDDPDISRGYNDVEDHKVD
ncbi:uncharacterized protein [Mytilus edulis]|uniref:uncharacterized protein n=1 Tax=Mytilus edulis TaxID=6550 RepID=UPI0039EFF048